MIQTKKAEDSGHRRTKLSKQISARCLLFDLDGTLYESQAYSQRLELEIVRYVSEALSLSRDEAKSILERRRKQLVTLTRTLKSLKIERENFFHAIAERIDPAKYLTKDPRVKEMMLALKARGFKLGLVSNSGRPLALSILRALGLETTIFDAIITSSEAEPKPSPESFLLAMHELGCGKNETVYIGDRIEAEIRPAHELGIKTILIDRSELQDSKWADMLLRNVLQVADFVNCRNGS